MAKQQQSTNKIGAGYITEDEASNYLSMSKRYFQENVRPYIPNYYFGRAVRFKLGDVEGWAQGKAAKFQVG